MTIEATAPSQDSLGTFKTLVAGRDILLKPSACQLPACRLFDLVIRGSQSFTVQVYSNEPIPDKFSEVMIELEGHVARVPERASPKLGLLFIKLQTGTLDLVMTCKDLATLDRLLPCPTA